MTESPRFEGKLRRRFEVLVAVVCALLGFGIVVQVRTNQADTGLAGARQEDLAQILDDLSARGDRLRQEIDQLQATRERLTSGTGGAALDAARSRARTLGILAGTVPATGPGIALTISDPQGKVEPAVLLETVEELRDAGAEAMQIADLRVVASTYFTGRPGAVEVSGVALRPPYRLLVIGDPDTLADAMTIPGGVQDTVARRIGAASRIDRRPTVTVSALRPLERPRYAAPTP